MSTTIIAAPSTASTGASASTGATGFAPASSVATPDPAAERRLALLVAELRERDGRHLEQRAEGRPGLWIAAMTAASVALAHLAVVVAVPAALG